VVIEDWPSPTAILPRAEARIHSGKASTLHPCRPSTNDYHSSFQHSNNDHWWAGPVVLFTRNWESSSASALGSIVSTTGYWDAYKLDIPMAMAMIMSTGGSRHRCHRVKTKFTLWLEISPTLLCLIPTMTYTWYEFWERDWILGYRTFRKWKYGGRCHCGCSFVRCSSPLFTSRLRCFFESRPSTNRIGTALYHLRRQVKWRCSFAVHRMRWKVAQIGTNRLWYLWIHMFAYIELLFDWFFFFSTRVRVYAAQGVCTERGG